MIARLRACDASAIDVVCVWYTHDDESSAYIRRTHGRAIVRDVVVVEMFAKPCSGTIVSVYGQANKRIRWMPWQLEAMKDVGACEKLRGVGNQTLIRRYPNGETHWHKPVFLD